MMKTVELAKHHPDGLVLGTRQFDRNVPLRSKFGNYGVVFKYLLSSISSFLLDVLLAAYFDGLKIAGLSLAVLGAFCAAWTLTIPPHQEPGQATL